MLVVADVNISQDEVEFLRGIETVELVVYVAQDLPRSIPDEEMVEYALENNALIVTRDKAFNLGVGIIYSIHPHLFLHRNLPRTLRTDGP